MILASPVVAMLEIRHWRRPTRPGLCRRRLKELRGDEFDLSSSRSERFGRRWRERRRDGWIYEVEMTGDEIEDGDVVVDRRWYC